MTALTLSRPTSALLVEDIQAPIPAGFVLDSGDLLGDSYISLRLAGAPDAPKVLALGGISAGRDVCGPSGWWRETLIDHAGIDLQRFCLIGVDFAPLGDQRVRFSPRDQARLLVAALDHLQTPRLHAFVGASYGGLVGLAFAELAPERLDRLCVISAAHRPCAQASAWRGVQRRIVEFGALHDDAAGGLALARQLAMITYRTADEFDARFGAGVDASGRGPVDGYLEARGKAYPAAIGAKRWLSLSESIDRALLAPESISTPTTLAACFEDQLVPLALVQELADRLPDVRGFHSFHSQYGHDAFLKEPARIAGIINACLKEQLDV
ncbi:alpha/beta fold hydrolase [Terricaulis sp.]|uniref:alpha/beta fold hydrolase n=1 Tax=Terricaulis sp. TaxID=2768686 RepID=UPI003783767E